MLAFDFKAYGKQNQFNLVDEAFRTAQFIRNCCLRYWIDSKKVDRYDLNTAFSGVMSYSSNNQ